LFCFGDYDYVETCKELIKFAAPKIIGSVLGYGLFSLFIHRLRFLSTPLNFKIIEGDRCIKNHTSHLLTEWNKSSP
jgi:hypothetical protein